jgi:glutamyl-tRNA synthetase
MTDRARPVRVRFAPSPTGYLHVGGGRTALYNWLFARREGGTFILRSDDTDQARSTAEFAADIVDSMRWLGIDWDEGIEVGGSHPSYHQSERFDRYRDVAQQLVAEGKAYYSFVTSEQLDAFRADAQAAGRPPAYDGRHRVDAEEAFARIDAGEIAPIRFAVSRPGVTEFVDRIRGDVRFDHVQVDDFVILRSDGSPTYHLASTVDDVDFEISHVIRGEDLLSSTPKHILLTRAMGAAPATYAHLPLLMGPDGTKLSKRHGHTSINAYRAAGFLPEAVCNYLAILSWSPGDEQEIVALGEMAARFRLDDVSKNPAVFDVAKLEWMNGVYIRSLDSEDFYGRVADLVEADLARTLDEQEQQRLRDILPHVQERTKVLVEVPPQVRFLFGDIGYDETSWDKVMRGDEPATALAAAHDALGALGEWSLEAIETALRAMLDEHGLSARKGLQPIRVAITGSSISPPLFESLEVLGRERSLSRIQTAAGRLDDAT